MGEAVADPSSLTLTTTTIPNPEKGFNWPPVMTSSVATTPRNPKTTMMTVMVVAVAAVAAILISA